MSVPAVPTALAVVLQGADPNATDYRDGAILTWTRSAGPPSPVEHYEIQVSPTGVGSGTLVYTTADEQTTATIRGLSVPGGGFAPRYFRIRAVNVDGSSSYTAYVAGEYSYASAPDNPSELGTCEVTATVMGPDSINLELSHDIPRLTTSHYPGFTHWRLKYNRVGFPPIEVDFDWPHTLVTVAGLEPGTTYQFQAAKIFRDTTDDDFTTVGEFGPSTPTTATTDAGSPALSGPSLVNTRVGRIVVGTFTFSGGGDITGQNVAGAPGLTVTRRGETNLFDLGGSVSTPGRFVCTVDVASTVGTTDQAEFTTDFVLLVTGGSFLSWFHDDPLRLDLQFDVRSLAVTSGAQDLADPGLQLTLGETRRIHVILRDGETVRDDAIEALALIVRPANAHDARALLRVASNAPSTESLGGADRAYLDVKPGGFAEQIIRRRNEATGAEALSSQITAVGELLVKLTGQPSRRSKPFNVVINQPYNR